MMNQFERYLADVDPLCAELESLYIMSGTIPPNDLCTKIRIEEIRLEMYAHGEAGLGRTPDEAKIVRAEKRIRALKVKLATAAVRQAKKKPKGE